MININVFDQAHFYVNNKSVVNSVNMIDYRLKKKHLLILYHDLHEEIEGSKIIFGWIKSYRNIEDILNKILPGPKLW